LLNKELGNLLSRCSAARLAHHVRDVEAGGSNPLISTFYDFE
jgi:hypothetical protein